ncbi:MAG: hypothetical protein M1318_07965 [Firmicutes bacterium]|nr:hypothetical protein [Bacillota bacterium]
MLRRLLAVGAVLTIVILSGMARTVTYAPGASSAVTSTGITDPGFG